MIKFVPKLNPREARLFGFFLITDILITSAVLYFVFLGNPMIQFNFGTSPTYLTNWETLGATVIFTIIGFYHFINTNGMWGIFIEKIGSEGRRMIFTTLTLGVNLLILILVMLSNIK